MKVRKGAEGNGNTLSKTCEYDKKSRSSRVCQNCRSRKVRCDLIVSGSACSNCREDEVACIEVESKRSRKYRQQKRRIGQTASQASLTPTKSLNPRTTTLLQTDAAYQRPPRAPNSGIVYQTNDANLTEHSLASAENEIASHHGHPTSTGPSAQISYLQELPKYVKRPPANFEIRDLHYLFSHDSLSLPGVEIRNELITAFVLHVYPYMPILDLQEFLNSILEVDTTKPCSLILLQAVLFAGSAFVDMEFLRAIGFDTRRAARQTLYVKVKNLYDFGWEVDPVSIIQALLLLTYWFESPEDLKDPWYWLGVCRILANRIGLGDTAKCLSQPPKLRSVSRRLWWSCILRDATIAVAMRKPLQFYEEINNIPPLNIEDFETSPISTTIPPLCYSAALLDPETRKTIARLCIEKVSLGRLATRILVQNYSPVSTANTAETTVTLYRSVRAIGDLSKHIELHYALQEWQRGLPDDCILAAHTKGAEQDSFSNKFLIVHQAILHMFFLLVSGLLYRPLYSFQGQSSLETSFIDHDVRDRVLHVAAESVRLVRFLCEQDMIRILPSFTTTFFISAVPTIMSSKQLRDSYSPEGLKLHLSCFSEAILRQRDIYPTADYAYAIIQAMIAPTQHEDTSQSSLPEMSIFEWRDDDPQQAWDMSTDLSWFEDHVENIMNLNYPGSNFDGD